MKVFAYCAMSFAESTRRAAGVMPTCCPPVSAANFDPAWLEGRDLLYFDLHGWPGEAVWAGDLMMPALTARQILEADLDGALVFASNCYLAEDDSPMLDALLEAGASMVVGGDGLNYGGHRVVFGAPLLGQWFRRLVRLGLPPLLALAWAKQRVRLDLRGEHAAAAQDALAFRAYVKKGARA